MFESDNVLFSIRMNARENLQNTPDSVAYKSLRIRVWDLCKNVMLHNSSNEYSSFVDVFGYGHWPLSFAYDNLPNDDEIIDDMVCEISHHVGIFAESGSYNNVDNLRDFVCSSTCWTNVYDFIEVVSIRFQLRDDVKFSDSINQILSECLSRYRFIKGYVCCVLDDAECAEIGKSLDLAHNISLHMEDALSEYSKRVDCNMNKVVANAISAVEASCVDSVSGKPDTLGGAIDWYNKNSTTPLDPNLAAAVKSFYHFTCNPGIRHGGTQYVALDEATARLSLILCAALSNYFSERNSILGPVLAKPDKK